MSKQFEFEIFVSEDGRVVDNTNTLVDGQKLVGEYPNFAQALDGARRLADALAKIGWKVNVVRCVDFEVEDGCLYVVYDAEAN